MTTNHAPLADVLEALACLLESDGDQHWSRWMRTARARLLDGDPDAIRYLLSAYGGMGSFNDLVLGQRYDSHGFSWKPGYAELNQRFDELRGEAYDLAQRIRRARAADEGGR
ncbi:DUF6966 domain-containing protein [Pseudomonas sp.]|uniref:DUF6966 domain-containing protein n=1 Tax=Pseudomonas sp. TaxID=306 RepID=UPI0028A630C7|nr:hypothetical protein [Pseudomonas sp.]